MLDKASVLFYYSGWNSLKLMWKILGGSMSTSGNVQTLLPHNLGEFLERQSGVWFSVVTVDGDVVFATNNHELALDFAKFQAGERPEIAKWRDGRKVKQDFPHTTEGIGAGCH